MRVWVADARFAAARFRASGSFADHAAPAVSYIGHSFGGSSALEACRTESRCTGAVDVDGAELGPVVRRGLSVRLLVVGHQNSCVTAPCTPRRTFVGPLAGDRAYVDAHGRAW